MFEYRILQTPAKTPYCFRSFPEAMEHGFCRQDYVSVYAGTVDATTINEALGEIFRIHNAENRPNGKGMRSLSVSDVVVIDGYPYYCDDWCWSEIPANKWR